MGGLYMEILLLFCGFAFVIVVFSLSVRMVVSGIKGLIPKNDKTPTMTLKIEFKNGESAHTPKGGRFYITSKEDKVKDQIEEIMKEKGF